MGVHKVYLDVCVCVCSRYIEIRMYTSVCRCVCECVSLKDMHR